MVVTGNLLILITGLFINGGAGGLLMDETAKTPNAIVMNTVIASATSGLTHTVMTQWRNMVGRDELLAKKGYTQNYNMWELSNSVVAGFVSISAGCNNVQLWESCVIGFIGSLIY